MDVNAAFDGLDKDKKKEKLIKVKKERERKLKITQGGPKNTKKLLIEGVDPDQDFKKSYKAEMIKLIGNKEKLKKVYQKNLAIFKLRFDQSWARQKTVAALERLKARYKKEIAKAKKSKKTKARYSSKRTAKIGLSTPRERWYQKKFISYDEQISKLDDLIQKIDRKISTLVDK